MLASTDESIRFLREHIPESLLRLLAECTRAVVSICLILIGVLFWIGVVWLIIVILQILYELTEKSTFVLGLFVWGLTEHTGPFCFLALVVSLSFCFGWTTFLRRQKEKDD